MNLPLLHLLKDIRQILHLPQLVMRLHKSPHGNLKTLLRIDAIA